MNATHTSYDKTALIGQPTQRITENIYRTLIGAAGAATGFARTFPMKGRARQRSWIARVRKSKSDSGSPKGGISADSRLTLSCFHTDPVHEIETHTQNNTFLAIFLIHPTDPFPPSLLDILHSKITISTPLFIFSTGFSFNLTTKFSPLKKTKPIPAVFSPKFIRVYKDTARRLEKKISPQTLTT